MQVFTAINCPLTGDEAKTLFRNLRNKYSCDEKKIESEKVPLTDYGSLLVLFSFRKYLSPNRNSFCLHVLVLVAFVVFVCGAAIAAGEFRLRPPF